jgi:acetylornithine deacetylase
MVEFIKSYLAGLGVESVVLPDETGKKASLLATIGPADKAGYVLSGHTDVVPVDGQDWSPSRCGVTAVSFMAAAFRT